MKKIIGLILLVTIGLSAESWVLKSSAMLNVSQSYYNEDWNGEEQSSINWVASINSSLEKQLTPIMNNLNTLKLAYGQNNNSYRDENRKVAWKSPSKSTDLIDFESILRFTLGGFVDPFASFRFESQFYDNSVKDDKKYVNPMTFTESMGAAKIFIKEDKTFLSTRLGLGVRQLVDQHADDTTVDGGLISITDYSTVILDEKVGFNSKLTLYQAFYNSRKDDLETDDWKALDVNWENIFTAAITDYLNVNLYIQMLYEKEQTNKIQIKETLSLGLTYILY